MNHLKFIWIYLSYRRKLQLGLLFLFMLITSIAEVISIGSVIPFLAALSSPEKIIENKNIQPFLNWLEINNTRDLLFLFTLLFCFAAIFACVSRITLMWLQIRFSRALGVDLSSQVFQKALYQPYEYHLTRHSSEILVGIRKTNDLIGIIIQPALQILGSLIILFAVISILFVIEPWVAMCTLFSLSALYGILILLTKRRIHNNSIIIANNQEKLSKVIQEGLGGIRDILLDGSQNEFYSSYRKQIIPLQIASGNNQIISLSPKFVIEMFGMVIIACIAYVFQSKGAGYSTNSGVATIAVLGAFALGAQRILPLLQQIYSSYITIKGNHASIRDALALLAQPLPDIKLEEDKPLTFQYSFSLRNLCFRYASEGPWVLKNLNLEIPKGTRLGIVGKTGSGKSTLIDLIMGLLTPTEGAIVIDGAELTLNNIRAWQKAISHVPQTIFLADTTIAENIAFGVPSHQINWSLIKQAAKQAQIANTIESWDKQYDTMVGERGVRLSGGQRQRIGIARALYKQARLIILDEATSALDYETEHIVMQTINSLSKDITVIVIAHRLTTLQNCDLIINLANKNIDSICTFDKLNIKNN